MIIDFHTHTFPDFLAPKVIPKLEKGANIKAFVDGTLGDLQRSMEVARIDVSVVLPVATTPSQVATCNQSSCMLNEEYGSSIISFGAMHPDYEDYKLELKRMKEMGLKGIKLHPDYQTTVFDDIKYKRIIDTASELGMITVVHAGLDIGLPDPIHAVPRSIKNVIREVQPEKLVLAHMGGFHLWEEVMELLSGENVYLDTAFSLGKIQYLPEYPDEKRIYSMMSDELFMEMVRVFGEDRILFATDSPWGGQKETLEAFYKMPLTKTQQDKILGKNAMKLMALENEDEEINRSIR